MAAMAGSVLVAVAGALLWKLCHLPLPWLVGSLYAVAFARIGGLKLAAPPWARQGGQWVIGTIMGLYFTSEVAAEIMSHTPLIVGMALASLLMGAIGAAALIRLRLADTATAFFAAMPGGASEMANLSDIWKASVDRVAAAHGMRVMLVVLVVPLALTVGTDHTSATVATAARQVSWAAMPLMAVASLAGAGVFLLLRLPNAWVLGPLSSIACLSIAGVSLSALPDWMVAGGQVLIGVALGCRFGPGFFRKAPAFLAGVSVISLLFLVATALLALALAPLARISFPNLVLSFAPGGISEMSITASRLDLGVPLVVASHVVRLSILTLLAPYSFRLFSRLKALSGSKVR